VGWESVVRTEEGGEEYVDMFWVDAHEQRGVIYLIGKVMAADGRYVSACCVVRGFQVRRM
jgi:hypothetical protein